MSAWLLVCAALVAAAATVTSADLQPRTQQNPRIDKIKSQILAKLGLTARPTPVGAPPRDVVRAILARATDYQTQEEHKEEQAMREVIAIAHRGAALPLCGVCSAHDRMVLGGVECHERRTLDRAPTRGRQGEDSTTSAASLETCSSQPLVSNRFLMLKLLRRQSSINSYYMKTGLYLVS